MKTTADNTEDLLFKAMLQVLLGTLALFVVLIFLPLVVAYEPNVIAKLIVILFSFVIAKFYISCVRF